MSNLFSSLYGISILNVVRVSLLMMSTTINRSCSARTHRFSTFQRSFYNIQTILCLQIYKLPLILFKNEHSHDPHQLKLTRSLQLLGKIFNLFFHWWVLSLVMILKLYRHKKKTTMHIDDDDDASKSIAFVASKANPNVHTWKRIKIDMR